VKKRSQLKQKIGCEEHWTKRDKASGEFVARKEDEEKIMGVRREP
jgi:hypothetical protein